MLQSRSILRLEQIQSEDLPIIGEDIHFILDQKLADEFSTIFEQNAGSQPLTMSCGAFRGMFKLLDEFQVNWLKLLHVHQSFEYRESFELPVEVCAESRLSKLRRRGGMTWLTFENLLWKKDRSNLLIFAESSLIVQNEEAS